MIYNGANLFEVQKAIDRIRVYASQKKAFEVTLKREPKTYSQLKYVHLLIKWFALTIGETSEYTKLEYFKRTANKELFEFEFVNRITGETRIEYRSLSTLRKDELTLAIDRFRNYSSITAGIYLPEPSDLVAMRQIEIECENNKEFL